MALLFMRLAMASRSAQPPGERFFPIISRFSCSTAPRSGRGPGANRLAARSAAIQKGLEGCTATPFEMMELSCEALELTRSVVGKLNASAASDLGCAALSLKAAIQGAWLNVLINIGGIQDQAFAEEYRKNGQALLERALPLADAIYQEVLESL